jgi:hypothetical protein
MRRPLNFKTEYILKQDAPYQCADEASKETSAKEGTLRTGRVVWLESPMADSESTESVRVYADGIGIVSVEPRFIKRIEG